MVVVVFLAVVNIFGVKLGALIQNVFTSAKALLTGSSRRVGIYCGAQRDGMECQFWRGLGAILAERRMEFAASGAGGRGWPDCPRSICL